MDRISFDFIDVKIPDFDPEFFRLWIANCVETYEMELGDLSYVFVSDEYLFNLNREHLNHDYYTDIITFNYNEGNSLSGDLFISLDRVKDNAEEYGDGGFYDELCRVMIHGVLHLIGYNDKSEEEEMEMRLNEEICLNLRKSFT